MDFLVFFSTQLAAITAAYVLMFAMIGIDLFVGVHKAKQRGEYRTSKKYRKTVDKLVMYYGLLFAATIIDALQMLTIHVLNNASGLSVWMVPAFTLLGTLFLCFIELTSIYERADQKTKETAKLTLENAQILAEAFINVAKDKDLKGALENIDKLKHAANE